MSVRYACELFNFNRGPVSLKFCRSYRKIPRNRNNIGISKRLSIVSEDHPDLDKMEIDDEAFDQMEADVTTARGISDYHKRTVNRLQKKAEFEMVRRKYFPDVKLPNLLTWSDKEQIKDLHRREPNHWTCHELSRSFPATSEIIKKVLKSTWKPENEERIIRHDKRVRENWERLKKGELDEVIEPSFKQHLTNFSYRASSQQSLNYSFVNEKLPSPAVGTEFSSIVANCRVKKLENQNESKSNYKITSGDSARYLTGTADESLLKELDKTRHSNRKLITLEELRKDIKKYEERGMITEFDRALLKGSKIEANTLAEVENIETMPVQKIADYSSHLQMAETLTEGPGKPFPMKIKIPQGTPRGSLYRVKDIYYDTDGKFLYRVPGMK